MGAVQKLRWRSYLLWLSFRMTRIRRKDKIRFLFVLQELSQWKTERLYQAMLAHPRFEPILGITPCIEHEGAEQRVAAYCEEKHYQFVALDPNKTIKEQIDVDLLCHQKPYAANIHPAHQIDSNRSLPTVYISYFIATIAEPWVVNQRACLLAWRQFVDNESCRQAWRTISKLNGINYVVTGSPMMDELLTPKRSMRDVWPVFDHRKRIIWAPHHTIGDYHWDGILYSTFLDICWFMLELKEKYRDKVYFVFKPHPRLFQNLVKCWGEEKARDYYSQWDEPGFSHKEENGKYVELLHYSDAMIHDCASYTVEYMYTGNPVMYVVRGDDHLDNMIPYAREAFELHYKARTNDEIERFVMDVIEGKDPLFDKRQLFKQEKLLPPNGKTACENIIDSILGK